MPTSLLCSVGQEADFSSHAEHERVMQEAAFLRDEFRRTLERQSATA